MPFPHLCRSLVISLVLLITISPQVKAFDTPKPGSPERKAICDVLRVPIEKEIGLPVIFRISHLRIQDGWAFMKGQPRTKDDKAINYSNTPLAEDAQTADELLVAVLRKTNGRWKVVRHAIFTTDVWWHGLHKELGAPIEIFDYQR